MDKVTIPLLDGTHTPWRIAAGYVTTSRPVPARQPKSVEWTAQYEDFILPDSQLEITVGSEPRDLMATDYVSAVLFRRMFTGEVNFLALLTELVPTQQAVLAAARVEADAAMPDPLGNATCLTVRWQHEGSFDRHEFERADSLLESGLLLWLAIQAAVAFSLGPLSALAGPNRAVRIPEGEWVNLPRAVGGTANVETFNLAVAERLQNEWTGESSKHLETAVRAIDEAAWSNAAPSMSKVFNRLAERVNRYAMNEEPLAGAAYWCLTALERDAGSREKAAQKYEIAWRDLKRLGDLTANRGGPESRKAVAANVPFTDDERRWIETLLIQILDRVGRVAQEAARR